MVDQDKSQDGSSGLGDMSLSELEREIVALRDECCALHDALRGRCDEPSDLIHANRDAILEVYRRGVEKALSELGVPNEDYPASVAYAVDVLKAAQSFHPMHAEGFEWPRSEVPGE